ncbi:MAG: amidohydrolase family protein [Chloroflexota bacterium]|nr:amidohydrolase family protein [Chloroflexota bacterium]MDE2941696.1 amidohydrolase family protein [Chloroflexota bacterium]MDE3267147.1 amidohydrolase family protein [Chloroflexota bacterium]
MNVLPRKPLLPLVAALAIALCASCVPADPTPLPTHEGASPSIVFHGGRVITMEPDMPRAEAIAVRDDEIVAVGSSEQILALAGPSTRVVDLQGRALLPGFIDAHTHLFSEAIRTGSPSLHEVQDYALRLGITAMADMSVEPPVLAIIRDFHDAGEMRIRTGVYPSYNLHCGEILGHWYADLPPERDPDLMLRVLGVKVFTDGWTCDLLPAFSFELRDAPDAESSQGHLIVGPDELARVLSELDAMGYQAVVHALGDRAVENALDAIESVLGGAPNNLRHRIEHNMFIRPELMVRYGETGAVPVIWGSEACFIRNTSHRDSEGRLTHRWGGPESHPWINAWQSLLDANPGLPVAFHSDMSWGEPGPVANLYSLTTRNEVFSDFWPICEAPEWLRHEAIDIEEALRVMTTGAAYSLHMEERTGSLKPGKLADLIVLSDDPLEIDPESLLSVEVLVTMVGGQVEHCAPQAESLCPG